MEYYLGEAKRLKNFDVKRIGLKKISQVKLINLFLQLADTKVMHIQFLLTFL